MYISRGSHVVSIFCINKHINVSLVFFEDLLSHNISGPCIKWRFLCFHLRSSHCCHINIIDVRNLKSKRRVASSGMTVVSTSMKNVSVA